MDSNLNQKVYYHTLGTRQEDDPMIFHTPEDPTLLFGVEVTGALSTFHSLSLRFGGLTMLAWGAAGGGTR